MKKISRLLIAFIIALLVISPVSRVQAAQSVKISKKTLSIHVGQNRTLYLSGTKNTVTWKSSNKAIAAVSKKGSVKGLSEGSVTITATVNKKSYSCKVSVLPKILTEKEKFKNISYTSSIVDNSLVVCLKNNNVETTDEIIALDVSASFYDATGELVYITNLTNSYYHVASGKELVSLFDLPKESTYPNNKIDFASYEVSIKPMGTINYKLDVANKLEVSEEIIEYNNYFSISNYNGVDSYHQSNEEAYNNSVNGNIVNDQRKKLNLVIDNNSKEFIDNIQIYVIYYKNEQIVGIDEYRGQINVGKSTLQKNNDYMFHSTSFGDKTLFESTDKYDSYKVFVNYAYVRY